MIDASNQQRAARNSATAGDGEFNSMLASVNGANGGDSAADPLSGYAPAVARRLGGASQAGRASTMPQGSASSAGVATTMPQGNLKGWIGQALNLLHLDGSYAPGINNLIQHESGGNPNSINKWDSNFKAGHPSKGLMQTIDGTFNQYALPGHNQIYNPVDNIIAGVRYARSRYGDSMIKSGGRRNAAGNYIGY